MSLFDDLTNPHDALEELYRGNRRFAEGTPMAPNRDKARLTQLADGQRPFAAFLGCADSRVPVEIVFDQGFGDLLVTRIAGNISTTECVGSLEFGAHVLGVKVIYVLGHTGCGAVKAAIAGEEVPGQISALFQHLRPAVRSCNGDENKAVHDNVRNQALLIAEASPVVSKLVRQGTLIVAGGVYDLMTGIVTPVEI